MFRAVFEDVWPSPDSLTDMIKNLDFRPHPMFRGGHLQTIAGFYWPLRRIPYRAEPILVDVPDGDKIALHDDCPAIWNKSDQVVLLLHGLAGCHGSGYMVRIARKLTTAGIRTFRMDMRGVGAATGLAKLPGHAGRTEDAAAAIEAIAQRCPEAPLTLVGFSMGGNVALGTLADAGSRSIGNLQRGIAIAPPVDLSKCCRELRTGVRSVYDKILNRFLVRTWQQSGGCLNGRLPKNIYQFDDQVTAPLSGYRDAEDYYAHASSGPRLRNISLPTRILAAKDDPVVAYTAIANAMRSQHVELCVTANGGHLGYFGRRSDVPDRRWMDRLVTSWICE